MLAAVFLSAWGVFTWGNAFPYYYHPDEPSKVRQVQLDYRNFHHPLLLLNTTRLAAALGEEAQDPVRESQRIAVVGRRVAAMYGAVAVTALVCLGWALGGLRVGLMLWPLLVMHEQLFELSHYFKEDTSLLAGLALAFLGVMVYERHPGMTAACALGAGAGLAACGKYIGVVGSVMSLAVLLWHVSKCGGGWRRNWSHIAAALLACVVVLLAVNWQLLTQSGRADFAAGLAREADFALAGHKGTTRSVPHMAYTASFSRNTNAVLWAFMVVHGVWLWRNRRRVSAGHWSVVAFPLLYTLILSFSQKVSDRYFLPATGFLLVVAALGAANLADQLRAGSGLFVRLSRLGWAHAYRTASTTRGHLVFALLAVAGILPMLPDFFAYARAFFEDDRGALIAYVRDNLPPDAKIAQDGRVNLPGDPRREYLASRSGEIPQVVRGAEFAADLGTLDELVAQGFTHVAVCKGDYGRFFREKIRPREGGEEDFFRRREFYASLLERGKLVWERKPGALLYFQPGLQLYSLAPLAEKEGSASSKY